MGEFAGVEDLANVNLDELEDCLMLIDSALAEGAASALDHRPKPSDVLYILVSASERDYQYPKC